MNVSENGFLITVFNLSNKVITVVGKMNAKIIEPQYKALFKQNRLTILLPLSETQVPVRFLRQLAFKWSGDYAAIGY